MRAAAWIALSGLVRRWRSGGEWEICLQRCFMQLRTAAASAWDRVATASLARAAQGVLERTSRRIPYFRILSGQNPGDYESAASSCQMFSAHPDALHANVIPRFRLMHGEDTAVADDVKAAGVAIPSERLMISH